MIRMMKPHINVVSLKSPQNVGKLENRFINCYFQLTWLDFTFYDDMLGSSVNSFDKGYFQDVIEVKLMFDFSLENTVLTYLD